MILLDIAQVNEALNFGKNLFGMLAMLGGGFWAVNKMWLSTIYQTKKDSESAFDRLQTEMHQNSVTTSKEILSQNDKLNRMEKEAEVFKEKYNGDMKLLQQQMATQTTVMQDIAHKVNNIANIKIANIVEMMIDEELKKRKL